MDGDLITNNFNLDTYTLQLNSLYQASLTLQSTQSTLQGNSNSVAIQSINTNYNNFINDITLTTDSSYGNNDITSILSEFRGWTDAGQNEYQIGCSPATYDVWVQSSSKCPAGYPQGAGIGSQSCLLIPNFTGAQAQTRYSTQSGCQYPGTNDFPSTSEAAEDFVTNINQYISDNSDLLNQLISENGVINTKFVNIAQNVLTFLNNMEGVLQPLIDIFEELVGNNGIFSVVNCGIILYDVF